MAASYFMVQNFIRSKWESVRVEIEKDIPTLMRNLSGILQTDANPLGAITTASQALDPDKPLKDWVDYFLA